MNIYLSSSYLHDLVSASKFSSYFQYCTGEAIGVEIVNALTKETLFSTCFEEGTLDFESVGFHIAESDINTPVCLVMDSRMTSGTFALSRRATITVRVDSSGSFIVFNPNWEDSSIFGRESMDTFFSVKIALDSDDYILNVIMLNILQVSEYNWESIMLSNKDELVASLMLPVVEYILNNNLLEHKGLPPSFRSKEFLVTSCSSFDYDTLSVYIFLVLEHYLCTTAGYA